MKAALALILLVIVAALAFWFGRGSSAGVPSRPAAEAPAGAVENDPRVARPATSAKQDPGLALSLVGEWQSRDDASSGRVFQANGNFYDTYNGDPAGAPGTWAFATDGSGELHLSSEGDLMRFRVVAVSATSLELTYLDRGNTLRFSRVK